MRVYCMLFMLFMQLARLTLVYPYDSNPPTRRVGRRRYNTPAGGDAPTEWDAPT